MSYRRRYRDFGGDIFKNMRFWFCLFRFWNGDGGEKKGKRREWTNAYRDARSSVGKKKKKKKTPIHSFKPLYNNFFFWGYNSLGKLSD